MPFDFPFHRLRKLFLFHLRHADNADDNLRGSRYRTHAFLRLDTTLGKEGLDCAPKGLRINDDLVLDRPLGVLAMPSPVMAMPSLPNLASATFIESVPMSKPTTAEGADFRDGLNCYLPMLQSFGMQTS